MKEFKRWLLSTDDFSLLPTIRTKPLPHTILIEAENYRQADKEACKCITQIKNNEKQRFQHSSRE
jgi:hypothetical protein